MPFTPGQSGNRAGRPKGFAGVSKQIMEATRDGAELVEWALKVWRDSKADMRDRQAAHQWLSDRGLGKPLATIDLNAEVGAAPSFDIPRLLARLPINVIDAVARELEIETLQLPSGTPSGD